MPSNYSGRSGPKKNDGKIADKFRDACPPHKVKDLDALVRQCKGDEAKIQAKITEWWDEPQVVEPVWESVGKVNKKQVVPERKDHRGDRGGDRGSRSSTSDGRDRGGMSGDRGGRRSDRPYSDRGGRSDDRPRRDARGSGAGRGGGGRYSDRDRNRGGDRERSAQQKSPSTTPVVADAPTPAPPAPAPREGIPTPVSSIPAPKGAWGAQSFAAMAAASSAPKPPPAAAPLAPVTPVAPAPLPVAELNEPEVTTPVMEPEEEIPEVNIGSGPDFSEDPTPSGMPSPDALSAPPVSVWGSKGGAGLIQRLKNPVPVAPPSPIPLEPEFVESEPEPELVREEEESSLPMPEEQLLPEPEREPEITEPEETLVKESSFGVSLESVLPPSVNGANINASGWEPILDPTDSSSQQQQQAPVDIPVVAISAVPSMPEPELISLPTPIAAAVPTPPAIPTPLPPSAPVEVKPSSVLNMGHWETGDGDDDLDFGFGSFGADADVISEAPAPVVPVSATAPPASAATHASPARPPPGLSMPPMPANAMLVHELENKLEHTGLGPKVDSTPVVSEKASVPSSQSQPFNAVSQLTSQMNPPGMSQYAGMGMYNMAPAGVPNGLGSMPGQFPLDATANTQQQPSAQQNDSRPGHPPSQLNQATQQQQVPYGIQPNATSATTTTAATPSTEAPSAVVAGAPGATAPGMPPGMPSMQYPNPAYMYAAGVPGQFNQMGHPAYGMQAAYGYGQQFAPQGGHQFGGYNQGLMGQQQQGQGYGAPSHYDDQRGAPRGGRDNHQGGGGGYNKGGRGGGGGYRGNRNNNQHHNNQQQHQSQQQGYGNNYQTNPNIGGYGASPYNMGYGHGGGYGNPAGPSGMDHYGMQQQQHQQQQQQQQQGAGGGYGGFSHQENDHTKKTAVPHQGTAAGQQGGFQQQQQPQQPQLHQQPLGLQGTSTDTATGGAGATGGWPGSRQQNWGGNWQQEN